MNPSGINTPPVGANPLFNPDQLLGELQDVRSAAANSLQDGFKLLGTLISGRNLGDNGVQELEAPKLSRDVNDITLRIGLLQDALNQLMQQVSRQEIKMRMNESNKETQQQLEKFEEQMRKAAEAAEHTQEANKKSNIFEAVSMWIQAVVSVISAVISLVAAVGQILTNPVGAAGLIVAGVALIGAAAVQITLAIDATLVAAGKEGFLSEDQKTKMKLAAEILGYIAIAGAMIGLVGGVVMALGQAGKAAGTMAGKEIGRVAATKMLAAGAKEAATQGGKQTVQSLNRFVYEAVKEAMKPLLKMAANLAATAVAGTAATQVAGGVIDGKIADQRQLASDALAEADLAAAAAKAIEAMIAKLRALIEQLQSELEKMVEDGQQTMSIIMGAIDDTAASMTRIIQEGSPA